MSILGYPALLQKLRERLKDGALTQTELARLAGVQLQHVNDVLHGRRLANKQLMAYLGFELRVLPTRKRAADESARPEHLEAGA